MYLTELWGTCRRRWPLLLVLVLAAACVWGFAAARIGPTYKAGATLVLVPPKSVESPDTNRYLDLGSLTDSVAVLARSMVSAETSQALEKTAPGATYTVTGDETTSAPILVVAVSGTDPSSVDRMLSALLVRVPANLADLQRSIGIKTDFQITTVTLTQDEKPKVAQSSRYRLLGALGAALVLLVGLALAAVDGLLLGRRTPSDEPGATPVALVPPATPVAPTATAAVQLVAPPTPGALRPPPGPPPRRPPTSPPTRDDPLPAGRAHPNGAARGRNGQFVSRAADRAGHDGVDS
jgi:hypothetical protein